MFKFVSSVLIGRINHASIKSNINFISTSSSQCLDCLCDCLFDKNNSNSSCYGINCFPSNHSCQRIEKSWIQETDLSYNSTSDQFLTTINLNFCSCYTTQNILNSYENTTRISISQNKARFIKYNSYDNTLIVLSNTQINQYLISNLTRIRTISTSFIPLNVLIDSTYIYISFYGNITLNKYDKNLNLIHSIEKPIKINNVGYHYGLTKWDNKLFVSDEELNIIWSINLITMNISLYLNMSIYNIVVFNIIVFNNCLYVSQFRSPIISIINLISFTKKTITFPYSIQLYRMQIDLYCNRIWFGIFNQEYSLVPILDLNKNKVYLYQAKGLLANEEVHLVEFDSNHSIYTVETEADQFYKYNMLFDNCK